MAHKHGPDDDDKFTGKYNAWFFGSFPRALSDIFKFGNARPRLVKALDLKGSETILDAGCGSGFYTMYLSKYLPKGKIFAVDLSEDMLSYLSKKVSRRGLNDRIVVKQGDLTQLPMDDASVDVAISAAVLHHVPDIERAVRELYRAIRPGGKLGVIDWDAESSPRSHTHKKHDEREHGDHGEGGDHGHGLEIASFKELLRDTGFIDITTEHVKTWIIIMATKEKMMTK
jgi:ubiquinone/menaquinone biosynthesis C-methylase UbiE